MEGGTRAGTIGFSARLYVRALIKKYHMDSVYSGESWTINVKSLHKCWPHLPSFRKVVPGQFFFFFKVSAFLTSRTYVICRYLQ